jgi:hypothetical protein
MDEVWSPEILKSLWESQAERLAKWVAKDRQDKGDDYLTVPVLQGMLEMLIDYYPEEVGRAVPN